MNIRVTVYAEGGTTRTISTDSAEEALEFAELNDEGAGFVEVQITARDEDAAHVLYTLAEVEDVVDARDVE